MAAEAERGDHLVVYSSGDPQLLEALRSSGMRCLVYGMRGGPEEDTVDGNLEFRPRSNEGFVDDLCTARGGGRRRWLLADERGGVPRQADAGGAAARASSSS